MNDILEKQIIELCALNKKHFNAQDFLISELMITIASLDSARAMGNINREFAYLCDTRNWSAVSDLPETIIDIACRAANIGGSYVKPQALAIPISPIESLGLYVNQISITALNISKETTIRATGLTNYLRRLYQALTSYVYSYYHERNCPGNNL